METHPEDFDPELCGRTWLTIVERGHFNFIDRFVVAQKYKKLRQNLTKIQILTALIDPKDISLTSSTFINSAPTITIPSGNVFKY